MAVPRNLLENGYIVVKQVKHGVFAFNRNDRFIGRSLDLYGEWAESEINLLARFIKPGATVLDVGANIGTHTVPFARMTGPGGSVIAFEPQRTSFHLLCANVALNCLTNVECLHQAVGAAEGSITVPVLPPDEQRNFAAVALGGDSGESVEMTTIDALELEACDLIKGDVEGMEAEVLKGARATIEAHRPLLYVENNTIDGARHTLSAVLDLGYRSWWDIALYYNRANYFGNSTNVFARYQPEVNLLCAPPGMDIDVAELVECSGPGDDWKQALHRGIASGNPRFLST
jgi:FkbM family methyltransferase